MLAGTLALAVAAIFAGAAYYVSAVEQPARLSLDERAALAEWRPAYKSGTAMQAPLAAIGFLLGALAWWQTRNPAFGVGALAMIANWPWTFLVIMPVNRKLMADDAARTDPQTRVLLEKWGHLHAVRTGLGLLAAVAFLWALA
ncbi:MAG TPA: DUF1772 domain-containing protein [Rhizomicrobium sp.]|nr:DUF1772 domain-containing protein [Rhizomicrobium sp.]